jgi:hypothetical protein
MADSLWVGVYRDNITLAQIRYEGGTDKLRRRVADNKEDRE